MTSTTISRDDLRDRIAGENLANLYLLDGPHTIVYTVVDDDEITSGYTLNITSTEKLTDGARGRTAYGTVTRPDGGEDRPKNLWLGQIFEGQSIKAGDKLIGKVIQIEVDGQTLF
jgi:hypothetical protein